MRTERAGWIGVLAVLATGCGGAGTAPAVVPAAGAPDCADAPAAQSDQPDADVLALAAAAKRCNFDHGRFDWECAAFKEWSRGNDDLFEGGNGNATILGMLEDPDVRTRTLAVERGFTTGRAFFADKKRAARLLAVVDKERDPKLLPSYGKLVAYLDGQKLFGSELKALARHPSSDLRSTFAEYALPQHATEFSLELVKTLLDDPDSSVRRSAVRSLSAGGRTRPSDGICATLKAQLSRADELAEEALEAGTSSKCPGMVELVMAEIDKRAAEPAKLAAKGATDLTTALSSVCWRGETSDGLKKKAFDIALKVAPKVEDAWRRRRYVDLFRRCDKTRAKEALAPYVKDADKGVVDNAKQELKALEEESAR